MLRYGIRDREAGNFIDWETSLENAEETLAKYEQEDKKDGNYTEDFYEIYYCDEDGKAIDEMYRVEWKRKGEPSRTWSHLTETEKENILEHIQETEKMFNDTVSVNVELVPIISEQ